MTKEIRVKSGNDALVIFPQVGVDEFGQRTIKSETGCTLVVSDGYHSFDELYDHRITLYIALCRTLKKAQDQDGQIGIFPQAWRSKLHSDGSSLEGWFVLGIGKEKESQITYHIPLPRWDETEFAETLDRGPEWDGHTSDDVLERLKNL